MFFEFFVLSIASGRKLSLQKGKIIERMRKLLEQSSGILDNQEFEYDFFISNGLTNK